MTNNTTMDFNKDMEYLLLELQKEWEASGTTRATIAFQLDEAQEVNKKLQKEINNRQALLTQEELTFEQSIQFTKQNYILLRLIKKILRKEQRTSKKGLDFEFSVTLDKEEYRIFRELVQVEEDKNE
ncbi:MAG: hypothetical protein K0R34_3102 [Herbinix sp.]|nr:hypothetical protein [Herbinix sp.]